VLDATGGGKQRGVGFTFVPPGATVDEASRQGSAHQSPESVKSETVAKDRPRISALNHAAVAIGLSPEDAEVRTTLKQVALTTGPSARVAQLEGQSTATAVVSSEAVLKERFKQVPQTDHSAVSSMSGRISNPGQDTERLPAVSPQPLTMGEVSPATVKPLQHEMLSELNTATSPDSKTNVPVSAQAGTPGHPTAAGFASTGADVSALETTVVGAGSSGDLAVTEKPRWLDQTLGRLSSMVANGEQRAELQLSPDHLGELEIHVKTRDNQASVLISASEASVREALASELERLRSLLSAGGYDSVDIELTTQSDHREPQHRQRHEHLNRASTGMFLASASEDAHGPGVEDRDLGSERLLSIYA
jgi:flagellar hook-length control protein FliK